MDWTECIEAPFDAVEVEVQQIWQDRTKCAGDLLRPHGPVADASVVKAPSVARPGVISMPLPQLL